MRSELQSECESMAGLQIIPSVWSKQKERGDRLQISASTARGIAGWSAGVIDLCYLGAVLIYFALWAVAAKPVVAPIALLSVRLSIAHLCMLAFCCLLWRVIFLHCGLYTWQHIQSVREIMARLIVATGACALVEAQVIAVQWHHGHYLPLLFFTWCAAAGGTIFSRILLGIFHFYIKPMFRRTRNAVIVGRTNTADIVKDLEMHPVWNYSVLGVVDSKIDDGASASFPGLGTIADLEEILMRHVVDEVIIALPVKSHYTSIERVIAICENVGVQVQYPEDLFDVSWSSHCHRVDQDHDRVILKMVQEDYRSRIKRGIDIVGATIGLIVCSPLFVVVAILIKSTSKGPVFFKQERYGLGKRRFRIYKFRTMIEDAEIAQSALEHLNQNTGPVFKIFKDPRVTRVGSFLRKSSIDELPQLINVLKGEMSLVGPRPLNLRDVSRFSEAWLMRRFSVKPGITCLWQISGRSNVSFDRWIEMDLHYIDHWSLHLDLRILALTLPAVIKGTGAA